MGGAAYGVRRYFAVPLSVRSTSPSASRIFRTLGNRLRRSRMDAVDGIVIQSCITYGKLSSLEIRGTEPARPGERHLNWMSQTFDRRDVPAGPSTSKITT